MEASLPLPNMACVHFLHTCLLSNRVPTSVSWMHSVCRVLGGQTLLQGRDGPQGLALELSGPRCTEVASRRKPSTAQDGLCMLEY
jgi:hypothetical protein